LGGGASAPRGRPKPTFYIPFTHIPKFLPPPSLFLRPVKAAGPPPKRGLPYPIFEGK